MSRILVADDARVVRMLMRTWLERLGHDVVEAVDGAAALSAIRDAVAAGKPFRVGFCDVNMPTLSGLQVLDAVRDDERLGRTPIVLVTTLGAEADIRRGQARGAAAYLTKPVTFSAVLAALAAVAEPVAAPASTG
jgi:CheY-like chemotaxis protein